MRKIGAIGPVQIKPGKGIEYYYSFFPGLYSRFAQEFGIYMTAPVMKYRFRKFWDDNILKGKPFRVDWIMGSALLIRKEIFEKIGGFDESFFLYEEETEWLYRAKKDGWVCMIYPEMKVLHNHHSSSSKLGLSFVHFQEFRSRIIFSNKHDRMLKRFIRKTMIFEASLYTNNFQFIKIFIIR